MQLREFYLGTYHTPSLAFRHLPRKDVVNQCLEFDHVPVLSSTRRHCTWARNSLQLSTGPRGQWITNFTGPPSFSLSSSTSDYQWMRHIDYRQMGTVFGTFFCVVMICGVLDFVSLTVAALRSVPYLTQGYWPQRQRRFIFYFCGTGWEKAGQFWQEWLVGRTSGRESSIGPLAVLPSGHGPPDQWKGEFHRPAGGFTEWSRTTWPVEGRVP